MAEAVLVAVVLLLMWSCAAVLYRRPIDWTEDDESP